VDELIEAIEKWLKAHPNPREKILVVGSREFSAVEVLDEIKKNTRMGQMFRRNIMQYATGMFLKHIGEK